MDGQFVCPDCWAEQQPQCSCCGNPIDGEIYPSNYGDCCQHCFEDILAPCSLCGIRLLPIDFYTTRSGQFVCRHCTAHHRNWEPKDFEPTEVTYNEIPSERTFGVEFETSCCEDYSLLYDSIQLGCKDDPSICGKEFITAPLYGDQGLQVIRDFCKLAKDNEWRTDNQCGLHIHLGLLHESVNEMQQIALAYFLTYDYWTTIVEARRSTNAMCHRPTWPIQNILNIDTQEDLDYFVTSRDRFEFVNWRSYLVHGTLEIRGMHGSLDAEETCNWVKAHLKFLEYAKSKTLSELLISLGASRNNRFTTMKQILGSDLIDFYSQKYRNHREIMRGLEAPNLVEHMACVS